MGKQVPQSLLNEIADGKRKEIEMDSYNNFNKNNTKDNNVTENKNIYPPRPPLNQNFMQNIPVKIVNPNQYKPPNKYSPQYAAYIGVKPRAQASARIGLGGAY
jgi:hypothetical protein